MSADLNLPLILMAALVTVASPGPATLAIAGTSMRSGRRLGIMLGCGVLTGSLIWSTAAAFGLGALMLAHAWVFEVVRYLGAAYLGWLALRSARAMLAPRGAEDALPPGHAGSPRSAYLRGLALHLTNPKAILFFGALYSLGVPQDADARTLLTVIGAVWLQSVVVVMGYAVLFSAPALARGYLRCRRAFEGALALGFGAASLRILTARLA